MHPRARKDGPVVHDLDGEVVVYDLARHRAHRLNRPAAVVWSACNGRRSLAELAALMRREIDARADEESARAAVERLLRAHLVVAERPPSGRVSRRRAVRALLVAPIVVSMLAPSVAQAASCYSRGHPCVVGNAKACCSQICIGGHCL